MNNKIKTIKRKDPCFCGALDKKGKAKRYKKK